MGLGCSPVDHNDPGCSGWWFDGSLFGLEAVMDHRDLGRIMSVVDRMGNNPLLLRALAAIGESLAATPGAQINDQWFGELTISASVKSGSISNVKVGSVQSHQVQTPAV